MTLLGETHLDTLSGMHTLAGVLIKREKIVKAVALYAKVYEGTRMKVDMEHPDTKEFFEDFERARKRLEGSDSGLCS
jgi:hypothetical protein